MWLYDLKAKTRELALGFMARHILKSRMTLGLDSNQHGFDEDVNVYLAHLLLSFADPVALETARSRITLYDFEVARQLDPEDDRVRAFFLYKTNADFLLFSLGILRHIEGIERLTRFGLTQDRYVGRAQLYYQLASGFHQQIYRRMTSVSEILEKLSLWFPRYLAILNGVRSEFFHFAETLQDQELDAFMESLSAMEREQRFSRLMDDFLDAYSHWLKEATDETKRSLDRAVQAIQRLKPDFQPPTPS